MKIIAFYLPQYHQIPENDKWWGEGFTEWTNVKKATQLVEGQYQPRIPKENNYYNLLDNDVIRWQAKLAKKNGIYGFCIYHYWFDGKLLLEKPLENLLNDKSINIHYCICWANEHWTNTWANKNSKILIEQNYGDCKQWYEHFMYLLPFFKDDRYIKKNNKPLVVIYRPELIDCLNDMLDYWKNLAVQNGLNGLEIAYQSVGFRVMPNRDDSRFDYSIEYHPTFVRQIRDVYNNKKLQLIKKQILIFFEKKLRINLRDMMRFFVPLQVEDYDDIWNLILNMQPENEKSVPGAFVDWDNTPRRGKRGYIISGGNPEKFYMYMKKQIERTQNVYHKDMIFVFAWNEWAEGGYLEPDEKYGEGYLKAIKKALIETNEMPGDE